MIVTQFHSHVQVFHSDNRREFNNQSFIDFFKTYGILHQTCAYMPQQNGKAERNNCHLFEVGRTLCFTIRVSKRFWVETVMTVAFLINRMLARSIDYQTSMRKLSHFHSIPSTLNLCFEVFGCVICICPCTS